MLIFKMAVKNLLRYKRRTIITSIAIAAGLVMFIYMDSLLSGWYGSTERQYMEYEVASGRIIKASWWEDKNRLPLSQSIGNTEEITGLLEELGIEYTPRTEFMADLVFYKDPYPEDGIYPAKITAIDPELDRNIFKLTESMSHEYSRGELIKEGDDGILVGNVLADKLDMEPGYPVRLQFTGRMGYQEVLNTRVAGIIKTDNHLINLNGVFLTLDTADYYLEMDGAVTYYSIKVPDGKTGEALRKKLVDRLPEKYRLLGYEEIAADFMSMQQMEDGFVTLFLFLIFIIAAVGVSNTMMMAIFERRREIGMMRAQGVTDRMIKLMFFIEAGGIGLVGTIEGLLIGALINIPLVNKGFNYGAMLKTEEEFVDFGGIVIDSHLKGVWSLESFIGAGIAAILVSTLVAWFPTHRMLKKEIPENLRLDG